MPSEDSNETTDIKLESDAEGIEPSKRRFRLGAIIGFVVAILLCAVGVGAYFGYETFVKGKPFTLSGTMTLNSPTMRTEDLPQGYSCAGTGGYDDIGPDTHVTVSDASGTVLAQGAIESGYADSESCIMGFKVDNVPGGKEFYKVQIAHRGAMTYPEAEAKKGIDVSLGSSSPPSTPQLPPRQLPPPITEPSASPTSTTSTGTPQADNTVNVTITMDESFRELPGRRCEGYGPFEGLHDNNIAYLSGASDTNFLSGSFATGFTESSLSPRSATQNACNITVTFSFGSEAQHTDPAGYYIQVGNPSQWRVGTYKPDPGPYGTIRLTACAKTC